VDVLSTAIKDLEIEGAEASSGSRSTLKATRTWAKKSFVRLPFKEEHLEQVKYVWDRDVSNLPLFEREAMDRYRIAESHADKFLKPAELDNYIVHEQIA
jgi:hypothetical protein